MNFKKEEKAINVKPVMYLLTLLLVVLGKQLVGQTHNYGSSARTGYGQDIIVFNNNNSANATGVRFQSRKTNSVDGNYNAFSIFNDYQKLNFSFDPSKNHGAAGQTLATLTKTGLFGIGTSAPSARLQIVGGSSNSNGGSVIIGETSSSNLRLGYNPAESYTWIQSHHGSDLYINELGNHTIFNLNSGSVGVGTATPKKSLHVNGDYYGRGHMWLYAAEGDGTDGTAYIQARDDSGTSDIGMRFRTQVGGAVYDAMYVNPTGNVGVGTINPSSKLHVNGNMFASGSLGVGIVDPKFNVDVKGDVFIRPDSKPWDQSAGKGLHMRFTTYGTDGAAYIYAIDRVNNLKYPLDIRASQVTFTSGNVGIGTTSPTAKLDVRGGIRANNVTLDIGSFPDYVFAPDYDLMRLSEIEEFINENHRLPGMPSEEQVVEEGMDLGEINVLLVEKVEELTLHSIAQQKQLEAFKAELEALRELVKK